MSYFVWIEGAKGPIPQLWNDDVKTGDGKFKPYIFMEKLTPEQEARSLDELAETYKDRKNG